MAPAAKTYTQDERPIGITTPLGKDALLLEEFYGTEGLSRLFRFDLALLAPADEVVAFDKILGQAVTVRLSAREQTERYVSGIVTRFQEDEQVVGDDGFLELVRYRAEIAPRVWLLTKNAQSRIFQQMSVPDILREVFKGYDVSYEVQGTYAPRDYCTQYRESDFAFASRLMEEEGIYYFFEHTDGGHTLVLADTPQGHPDIPGDATVPYNEAPAGEDGVEGECILEWRKMQELRSGKGTLWDFCFEMPDKADHLQATQTILASVDVGTVSHKLKVGGNDKLEVYDYPGRYAQRFDGVTPDGGDRAADLQKIFKDNARTVQTRVQEEAWPGLTVEGESDFRPLTAGHKFTLDKHYNADGDYVLTEVEHAASIEGAYTAGEGKPLAYRNRFRAVPAALPFRPARVTPKARVDGLQTALVVGPKGEEIFTDKYGRIKVQFHWDRKGKSDINSSCWVRVATPWAGQQWGVIHIPRIGQEVLVAFEEGDPDQPVVVGSLYNAVHMPPYKLPDNKTQSGAKSRSTLKGDDKTFNELRFEDKKDSEQVYFHAQKDFVRVVENNDLLQVGYETQDGSHKSDVGSQTIKIYKDRTETIETGNETITIAKGNRTETIKEGNEAVTLEKGSRTHKIKKDDSLTVEGKQTVTVTGDRSITVKQGNESITIKMGNRETKIQMGNDTTKVSLGKSSTEAMQAIELKVGANSIKIDQTGITLSAMMVKIEGKMMVQVKGLMVQVNGDAMVKVQGGITMIN